MNERLQTLYKEALTFAYKNVPRDDWNTGVFHPIVLGKFAELIVQECAEVANDWYQNHNEIHWTPMDHIIAHLGSKQ